MIDIFSDELFRMELGRLASEQVVTRRTTAHNEFQRVMVKLKEAEEQPREVKSPIAGTSFYRMPTRQPEPVKTNLYDEVREWLANARPLIISPTLPKYYVNKLKEHREFFTDWLSEGPIRPKETVQPLPPNQIIRWNENTWLRWHPEKQNYMVMKNPPKPQGRLA